MEDLSNVMFGRISGSAGNRALRGFRPGCAVAAPRPSNPLRKGTPCRG
jgi:hypothetical protein